MNSIPGPSGLPAVPSAAPAGIDVAAERARTAGARLASHFNSAGSALPSRPVVATVIDHLRREEEIGGYEAAAEARPRVEAVYASAAQLIGADAEEIALLDSASTGLRVVLDALRPVRPRRIIATSSTYVSHALHLMTIARESEIDLLVAPTGPGRGVDLDALARLLADGPPAIVTAAHVPTSSGLVEPAAAIGTLVREAGGVFLLDATQSVGHLRTDVAEIGCDVLVTTGRKFLRAPRGTGFAYIRHGLVRDLAPTSPDVRAARWTAPFDWELDDSARRFETWEAAVAARLGLGAALDEALARGSVETERWLVHAGARLRAALEDVRGVSVADPADARSAIVTFVVEGVPAARVVQELTELRVRVVSVPATHGQWDLGDRGIPAVVRASAHVYNDESDIAALVDGVAAIARRARTGAA
ncbi:aminotransferase class V-fold PLP-dependent enzyme [Microbacterium sp. SORGH_AS_0888]|uniref:aminotransferase class V-fold PLP-dependent enzyme n=1 Tax=Microbacterium sp. SORGH_AS_0888 TaxID=3041791 RepID=UPI0027810E3B|nr:aminotransferase class V-fold PLP-dependent enzyme [Microbacterium sp. SORGH_AS_0888]MDQ1129322.1 selenocysteine lyase/cysteine desulfurase [Microbacterium sp. SORGH_AS_0888]